MITNIINGGSHRYLSELNEFYLGIPHGVVNKTRADVGGTFAAAVCSSNYIIVCPFRDLVDSIALDKNNKYEVFRCYGGVRQEDLIDYLNRTTVHKIAVTFDSFPKLTNWIGNVTGWKLLVDEYHLILDQFDFRDDAISAMLDVVKKFEHFSFLSATPIDDEYEIPFLKALPHYKVVWDNEEKIEPILFRTASLTKGLARFIQIFLNDGFELTSADGQKCIIEQLFVFLNSVITIKQILDTVELDPADVKICCATKIANDKILSANEIEYEIASVNDPNKRINFFTKKGFQGCNLFSNNGLIIVASDAYKSHTLVDVSTTLEQIIGRLRFNNEYQNIFRNVVVHIYSTNRHIMTDAEFEAELSEKRNEARALVNLYGKGSNCEKTALVKRLQKCLENDILSIVNGKLVYNHLKEQSFLYKQKLRSEYRNGVTIRNAYQKSEKFKPALVQNWIDLNVKLAKAVTVSYEQLLKDYLAYPSDAYDIEYPEFKLFCKYLKESEMNTLRWNKDKMLKVAKDKQALDQVFLAMRHEGFVSCSDLKKRFAQEFKCRDLDIVPKAALIEQCTLYRVDKAKKKIDGKTVKGYVFHQPTYISNVNK